MRFTSSVLGAAVLLVAGCSWLFATLLVSPANHRVVMPADSTTVTNYYKQNVYDPSDAKIGEITDVLVGKDGKVEAFIVSVGGFLGVGQKDVVVIVLPYISDALKNISTSTSSA